MTSSDQENPMTDTSGIDRIPLAHSVHYAVRGLPVVPNQYGKGVLAPSEITLTYRAAPDSQLGRVHAYVAGRLWVEGAEVPLLNGGLYGQHYVDGLDDWPQWLAEETRLHDPEPAAVEPPADRAALREAVAEAIHADRFPDHSWERQPEAIRDDYRGTAGAVLAVLPEPIDRAAVLREADWIVEHCPDHGCVEPETDGCHCQIAERLRRMADETATAETSFTRPAHYRRDDGVDCCVHAIPVGPDSCQACRELADDQPASGPTIVDQVVAALQAKAQALSVEAEEEMRRDLEEQAQVWHEAADLARRTGRKAARSAQPAAGARQDGEA